MIKRATKVLLLIAIAWMPAHTLGAEAALSAGCFNPTFQVAPFLPAGDRPFSVVSGDFNRDGWPDLATANLRSNNVSVLLGRGDGSFTKPTNINIGDPPFSVVVGDFNRDGRPDLVTANQPSNTFGRVSLLFGRGDGTFTRATTIELEFPAFQVAVEDFNRDGREDLVVLAGFTLNRPSPVAILLGHGDGSFSGSTPIFVPEAGGFPTSMVVSDFNLDARPDVAVTIEGKPNAVSVLLGKGDGTFGSPVSRGVGDSPFSVVVGDFNLDGRPDLATTNVNPLNFSYNVSVLLGRGDGSFQPPIIKANEGFALSKLSVEDFNLDGRPDLAVSSPVGVLLWIGNGNGTFSPRAIFTTDVRLGSFALATDDFNRDGQPDLAATTDDFEEPGRTSGVTILLGKGDGTFKGTQAFRVGVNRGVGPIGVGDFNSDGLPDLVSPSGLTQEVSLLLGLGDGAFRRPRHFRVETGGGFIAVADLNHDGRLDLVTAGDNLSLLLGQGNGTFRPASSIEVDGVVTAVAVADFNSDGHLDLAANVFGAQAGVSILLGRGNGTFNKPATFDAGNIPWLLAVADFNRDRRPDLAVVNICDGCPGRLAVLFNRDGSTFAEPTFYDTDIGPLSVAVGDFNRDGRPDLVIGTAGQNIQHPSLSVLLGRGNGTFRAAGTYPMRPPERFGISSLPLVSVDLNLDGILDLVAGHLYTDVSVLLGRGDGTFRRASIPHLVAPGFIAVGDFNLDGRPDLATDTFGGAVAITLSTCGLPPSGPTFSFWHRSSSTNGGPLGAPCKAIRTPSGQAL